MENHKFKVGDEVAYGLHGKCLITGIEEKELGSAKVSFYQVRSIRNPISAKNPERKDASILIPVTGAEAKGLRPLMTKEQAESVLKALAEPDYHYELNTPWVAKQKIFEEIIRKEGAAGLAKVVGHLHVVMQEDAVPPSDVVRFYENAYRLLLREITDALKSQSKDVEPLLNRALRSKLARDH